MLLDYKAYVITCFMWNFLHTSCLVGGNSTECGGNVTGSYGRLKSINFPLLYPKNMDCYWTVVSPEGTTLFVRVINVGLDNDCGNEFLQVTENGHGIRMCNHRLSKPFQTSGNVVNVHFVSDDESDPLGRIGFNLEWKVKSLYTFHEEHLTWTEALEVCALNGGGLVSEYDVTEMVNLVRGADIKTVWQGKYFTNWAWLEGCFEFDGNEFGSPISIKSNQMKKCLDYCHDSNYFGLQAENCYCFNSFVGQQLPTGINCTKTCLGNYKEICGDTDTLTIYMNDICYTNSTQWSGTIARTYSGKLCIPWKDVMAKDQKIPDESVQNASNYCRDPDSSLYLWCYVNATHREQCDIPKCIDKDDNDTSSCMVFRGNGTSNVRFKQFPCNGKANNSCLSKHGALISNLTAGDWTFARKECPDNSSCKKCKGVMGSSVFRLNHYGEIKDYHWLGYSRTKTTASEITPTQQPSRCFTLSKLNSSSMLHETVAGCNEKKAFICEHVPITCGENLTDLHGEIYSPGYPTGYGAYLHCVWNLVVAVGSRISLSYEVDIEDSSLCRSDSVKITDRHNGITLAVCGESAGTFNTTGNTVTIMFMSDKTVQKTKGFYFNWSSIPNPGKQSADSGGVSIGVLITLIFGSLCIIGLVVLVFAAIYYRKKNQQIPDSIACNVELRDRNPNDLSAPLQAEQIIVDDNIDQISGASFEVSNDSNTKYEDSTSYANMAFSEPCKQGAPSERNKINTMDNMIYALPNGHIGDISGTICHLMDNSQGEDLVNDDTLEYADQQAINTAEDVNEELKEPIDGEYCDQVVYSYAKEGNFSGEMVTAGIDNIYEEFQRNDSMSQK